MAPRIDPAGAAATIEIRQVDLSAWDAADEGLLSPDERARADRFVGDALRRRFIVGRAALRRILAARLDAHPARLVFRYGAQGKPMLADGGDTTFNIAHCGDLMLCAVARHRRVGIDVERMPAPGRGDLMGIARRCFSAAELASLADRDADQLRRRFAACWTRKEAAIKATGLGLSTPLDAFSVPVTPGALRCAIVVPDVAGMRALTLESFDVAPDVAAAVAAEGEDWRLLRHGRCRRGAAAQALPG